MPRITDRLVRQLTPPAQGNRIEYDDEVTGFGVRVTAAGAKAFVLRYVLDGRERRMTLGKYPDLSPSAARERAVELRGRVARGEDPLEGRREARDAPSVRDLARDYLARHAEPRKRPGSVRDDRAMLTNTILPALGARKVRDVRRRDVEALHQALKATPYRANRVLALLSKMFNLAVAWDWRADNPARGVGKFPEERRERWLSEDELVRLAEALERHPNRRAADAVRLLMLTGARRSEALRAEWPHVDFERGVWTKPSHHTKQKRAERVPLSAPAMALLGRMRDEAVPTCRFLFPGDAPGKPLQDVKKFWRAVCREAGLEGVRLHDLRHTYASHLVSAGLSLELVGRLLGHTQAATTKRYAHLADTPLREATERFGALVEAARGAKPPAEVVPLRKGGDAA